MIHDYINTMKTIFYFSFDCEQAIFELKLISNPREDFCLFINQN